jgi:hypothetical protein
LYHIFALCFSSEAYNDWECVDLPRPARYKFERRSCPTPMKVLIQRVKAEVRKLNSCGTLESHDNGLLIPELVPIAHRVYKAKTNLLNSLSKMVNAGFVQKFMLSVLAPKSEHVQAQTVVSGMRCKSRFKGFKGGCNY